MKVIYETPDVLYELDDKYKELLDSFPEVMKGIVGRLLDDNKNLKEKYLIARMEKNVCRIKWSLRSIESEIIEEAGTIKILKDGRVQTLHFSSELVQKIHKTLADNFRFSL